MICIVTHNAELGEHYFNSYKICVNFKGTYQCVINGTALNCMSGHVLNRNTKFTYYGPNTSTLIYIVEAESKLGKAVQLLLSNQPYLNLSPLLATPAFKQLLASGNQALLENKNTMLTFASEVLLSLFPTWASSKTRVLDKRIREIIQYIDANIHQTITLSEVADLINLSVERTRHLFEEETNISFSRYVLWKRLKLVIQAVVQEETALGQAAHQFGFFDQPHFNRSFKQAFGVKPSDLLKNNPNQNFILPMIGKWG